MLLVPGAGGDPTRAFSAGLEPLLRAHRYPVCGVTLPDGAFGDIQVEAEYVVASIRKIDNDIDYLIPASNISKQS